MNRAFANFKTKDIQNLLNKIESFKNLPNDVNLANLYQNEKVLHNLYFWKIYALLGNYPESLQMEKDFLNQMIVELLNQNNLQYRYELALNEDKFPHFIAILTKNDNKIAMVDFYDQCKYRFFKPDTKIKMLIKELKALNQEAEKIKQNTETRKDSDYQLYDQGKISAWQYFDRGLRKKHYQKLSKDNAKKEQAKLTQIIQKQAEVQALLESEQEKMQTWQLQSEFLEKMLSRLNHKFKEENLTNEQRN